MRRILPAILGFILILLIASFLFRNEAKNVSAAPATHLVISEVQIAGVAAGNDFIELYNPTDAEISLEGLRLAKRSSTGSTSASIVAFASDEAVPAHGYYLWCNTTISAAFSCDRSTSATVADNNSIALIDGTLSDGTVVDALTFGAVASPLGEGTSLTAPTASSSVERKANSSSDSTSMGAGGSDELAGNGEDTDDNAADFVSRATSQPQNSSSAIELPAIPTPTPSIEPSPTPTPAAEPTPSPTPTLSPSPSPAPPTPTPLIVARGPNFTCSLIRKSIRIFNRTFFYPSVGCVRF